jgi:hypothetical protein
MKMSEKLEPETRIETEAFRLGRMSAIFSTATVSFLQKTRKLNSNSNSNLAITSSAEGFIQQVTEKNLGSDARCPH